MAGEPSHFERGVPDAARAKAFFGALLGWQLTPTHGENAWIETGGARGGVQGDDEERSIVLDFAVADIEAAAARVRELGGEAGDPEPAGPGGRYLACRDDQGVAFGLHEPADG